MIKSQSAEIKNMLAKSFMNFMSDEDIQVLLPSFEVEEIMMLQRISRDEQPQFLYFILEGEIILKQRGSIYEISRLDFGQSLELKSLLLRAQQWQFEWFAESKARIAKVAWAESEKILVKYPSQLQYLARMTQSVSLQRLKRDLLALNVKRSSIVDFIAIMKQEKFGDIAKNYPGEKVIGTVSYGEIFVQINDDERPYLLTTFQAGDTAIMDPGQTTIRYWGSEDARCWIISEKQWQSLLDKKDFSQFLEFFSFRTGAMLTEEPQIEMTKTFAVATRIGILTSAPIIEENLAAVTAAKSSIIEKYHKWRRTFFKPVIPTSFDENRTGTAAILFFLRSFGVHAQQKDIDVKAPDEWSDTTLEALQGKMQKVGLKCEVLNINNALRNNMWGDIIVQLGDGFALVYDGDDKDITIGDFNSGKYRIVKREEFLEDLGIQQCLHILECKKIFQKQKNNFSFRNGLNFLLASPRVIGFYVLGGILGFICDLTLPVLSQNLLDQVVSQGRVNVLNFLISIFLTITVLSVLLDWFNQIQSNYLTSLISVRIKNFFHEKIFKTDSLAIQRLGVSQLMTRISDIDQISAFMVSQFLQSFLNIFLMFGSLSVLFLYNYHLVLIVFTVLPIGLVCTHLLRGHLENLKIEQSRNKARENRLIIEHFSSQDDMRTLKGILSSRWKWDFNNLLYSQNLMKNQKLTGLFQVFQLLSSEGVKIACFFYSIKLYVEGHLTLGQVMAVVMLVPKLTMPLQSMLNALYQYHSVRVVIERINDFLPYHSASDEQQAKKQKKNNIEFKDAIEVRKVQFKYESESVQEVLRGFDCVVRSGEKIAVVGPAGAGKSTLAYLLSGLYEPTHGSIVYDSLPLREISTASFAQKLSLVEQEGRLFSGTILENIALGNSQPDLAHAVKCAKIAGIEEDILARQGGFSSTLLHGGVGLSEGQRQRLLIARGLYKSPQVLILDEATSFLDPISESIVIKNILEYMKNKTVIFLTQRIQITTKVDRVFFMEQGAITESGSHRDLIEAKKRYFDFYLKHLSIC